MRKILSILVLLFITLPLAAQNMKFMGIPLGSSIASFKQSLINKGFSWDSKKSDSREYNSMYIFDGKFSGERVGLSVCITPKTRKVYEVCVRFKDLAYSNYGNGISFDDQDYKYDKLYQSLCNKYGQPTYYKIKLNDQFPCSTLWETSSGTVELFYSWYKNTYRNLDLVYTDYKTSNQNETEKDSDL